MSYYAPFYSTPTYYSPNYQNGYIGQNMPPQQLQNISSQQNDGGMLWVLGKNEAESYPVAPNNSVVLWDKNSQTIYIKSMSANRIPSMRTLDFVERSETPLKSPTVPTSVEGDNYVTKEEISEINGKIAELATRCETLEQSQCEKQANKPQKKTKESDE